MLHWTYIRSDDEVIKDCDNCRNGAIESNLDHEKHFFFITNECNI